MRISRTPLGALAPLLIATVLPATVLLPAPAFSDEAAATQTSAEKASERREKANTFRASELFGDTSAPAEALAGGPLEALIPFIGRWEIQATWADGSTLHSRAEYEPRLGGAFVVARTFVKKEDGSWYQRYETVFGHEEGKGLATWGFTYDGSAATMDDISVSEVDGKTSIEFRWEANGAGLKQSIAEEDGKSFGWQVWARAPGAEEYGRIMDSQWKRLD